MIFNALYAYFLFSLAIHFKLTFNQNKAKHANNDLYFNL